MLRIHCWAGRGGSRETDYCDNTAGDMIAWSKVVKVEVMRSGCILDIF